MEIKCQAKEKHGKSGCRHCGGYGHIVHEAKCQNCQRPYWTKPGSFTTYDGKIFRSFDGLLIRVHFDRPWTCEKCEPISEKDFIL